MLRLLLSNVTYGLLFSSTHISAIVHLCPNDRTELCGCSCLMSCIIHSFFLSTYICCHSLTFKQQNRTLGQSCLQSCFLLPIIVIHSLPNNRTEHLSSPVLWSVIFGHSHVFCHSPMPKLHNRTLWPVL